MFMLCATRRPGRANRQSASASRPGSDPAVLWPWRPTARLVVQNVTEVLQRHRPSASRRSRWSNARRVSQ